MQTERTLPHPPFVHGSTEKWCPQCKKYIPLDDFHKNPKTRSGLASWCRFCITKSRGQVRKLERPQVWREGAAIKCNKCGQVKPQEMFRGAGKKTCPNMSPRRQPCKKCFSACCLVRQKKLRLTVIKEYGGQCACCGEGTPEFLTVDHIYNDGAELRKVSKAHSGSKFYLYLRRHNFPKDRYQLLCWNCNLAKARYGICPHQKRLALVG